ncbi:hypothetical protein BLOT_015038 [Blomia tropicalis]|nr:hypothetical protein BLOT_015038 [Blomia tropicalis]
MSPKKHGLNEGESYKTNNTRPTIRINQTMLTVRSLEAYSSSLVKIGSSAYVIIINKNKMANKLFLNVICFVLLIGLTNAKPNKMFVMFSDENEIILPNTSSDSTEISTDNNTITDLTVTTPTPTPTPTAPTGGSMNLPINTFAIVLSTLILTYRLI